MTLHRRHGPFERVRRAQEHLVDLNERLAALSGQNEDAFVPEFDSQPPYQFRVAIRQNHMPAPMSIGIRIGEICYNLRSALDYLIFELALLDSSVEQPKTQFPIEDTAKGFAWRRKQGWLKGVNPAHVAAIERLQPYNGCDWTKALRDFSNRDKHRQFVGVRGNFLVHGFDPITDFANFDEIQAPIRRAVHPVHGEMNVKVHVSVTIEFADGTPIMDTLTKIQASVHSTLMAFEPDF
jgi:hypothetical protein